MLNIEKTVFLLKMNLLFRNTGGGPLKSMSVVVMEFHYLLMLLRGERRPNSAIYWRNGDPLSEPSLARDYFLSVIVGSGGFLISKE